MTEIASCAPRPPEDKAERQRRLVAQSENVFGAPGRPDGDGRHASVASAESHSVTSPRWTKACSYADPFPTRYFVLYRMDGDLMSRSCTRTVTVAREPRVRGVGREPQRHVPSLDQGLLVR